jgi:hypothetical protein
MIGRTMALIIIYILCTIVQQECFFAISSTDHSDVRRFTMVGNKDILISAQVMLRPASGKAIDSKVAITADNLAEFAPSPSTVTSASEIFRARGFEVGPMVGVSFSVTGTLQAFEEFFGMRIRIGKDGAYEFVVNDKVIGHELSSMELPKELHNFVAAVAFPLPPDFGPANF